MNRRRALMVFSGAFEFKRENNKEIVERETDQEELPKLMREIEEHERNISKPPTDQVNFNIFGRGFPRVAKVICAELITVGFCTPDPQHIILHNLMILWWPRT